MEAVAAVDVAAAAVQFFEVAAKAIKTCSEIRQSASGESKHNKDLRTYVQELQQIQASLKAPLPGTDPQTNAIADIRLEVGTIAKELLSRLEKVHKHGPKGWHTFVQVTLRTMHESKRIKELEHRYRACQQKFQEALSVEMRNAIARFLEEQGKANDTLLNTALPEVHTRLDKVQDTLAQQAFLDSLFFPEMFARHRSIGPPSEDTYQWIFDHDTEQDEKERAKLGRFKHWLSTDEPYFWINGKAGSGKSSLMSFIESDKRTEDTLKVWAGSCHLYLFSFFFWRPGSGLQKGITGLLQCLLYQLVKKKPASMGALLSSDRAFAHSVWTETTLVRATRQVLSQYRNDRLFFLIDGIDEYEGQYMRLLDTLLQIQSGPNIKLCLSSRPEAALVRRLASFPSIRLQDVNFRDMDTFVGRSLEPFRDDANEGVVSDVVNRSQGVFLWAVLVCKSLVTGYEAGDDEDTIQRRLNAIPSGIEPLLSHMFSNIEDVHRESLSVYFSLLKWGVASVALVTILLRGKPFDTLQQYAYECRSMKHRILAQSKGLIELDESYCRRDYASSWALLDISTGLVRTDVVPETECEGLTNYGDVILQWIHRSAYDCVSHDPFHDTVAMLRLGSEVDLARSTLAAATWLAKHVSQIFIESDGSLVTHFDNIMKTIVSLTMIPGIDLSKEVHQALDGLFDVLMSSVYPGNGHNLCPALLKCPKTANKIPVQSPFASFWYVAAQLPDLDGYFIPRFEQIEHSTLAMEPLVEILVRIAYNSRKKLPVELPTVLYRATDVLCRRSGQHSRAEIGVDASGAADRVDATARYETISASSSDPDDVLMYATDRIVLAMLMASWHLRTDRSQIWQDFIAQLYKVCDALQIYHGHATECTPKLLSPLQMQMSQVYITNQQVALPDLTKLRRQRTMRLLCLDRKQLATTTIVGRDCLRVTAWFDVSEQCSTAMGELVVDGLSPFGGFAESMGQERCMQLVLDDIWDDPDKRLDAWQRLYVRAYVRRWFKYLWVRRAGM
jgi:hypothetical protein